MKVIVLLLILLSSTFMLSRLNLVRQIQGLLIVPLIIGAGALLGPRGLFPLDQEIAVSMDGTIRMVLVWMGFLAGLRATARDQQYQWHRQGLAKITYILLSAAIIFLVAHFVFQVTEAWGMFTTLAASLCLAALFVTSSYFSSLQLKLETSLTYVSYADGIFLILSFFVASMLFKNSGGLIYGLLHIVVSATVALVTILIAGRKLKLETPDRLMIAGLVALAGGWAAGISVLEVIVGFLLGAMISVVNLIPKFDNRLLSTEVPLRMVLYFYAGLVVSLSWDAFFIALILTLLRFLAKWWLVQRHGGRGERLSTVYRFSTLSVPLLLSLLMSPMEVPITPLLLAIMCFAYLINDLLLVAELSIFHAGWSDKRPSQPDTEAASS